MSGEIEISPNGSLLVYKNKYSAEYARSIIQEQKLCGLRIFAQLKDDRLPDLDFLSEYSFLEALDITSVDDCNFGFLAHLKNLKDLTINVVGKNTIDLSNQINLENLTIQWRKGKILGLDKCYKITSLCLVDYEEEDLTPIASLINLYDLKVKTASVKNVNGIENFTNLKSLLLGNCKKLSSICKLDKLKNATSVSFELCPQIIDYELIGCLSNLENLQISDCKSISTIRFLQKLPSLNRLVLLGNTDVLDGDLIPAKNIKEVFYKHRKHYNIKIDKKNYDSMIKNNLKKIKGMFK